MHRLEHKTLVFTAWASELEGVVQFAKQALSWIARFNL
jgi:hypothetical protein